jgi:dipeptidase
MCDTIGRRIGENHSIFAKNSDRSPNEPQIIEFIEHKRHTEKTLKCTYISIDQVEETNAMVISRPVWLWGAEMGVNEHGVCIGNEAVFTKGKYGPDSLIGMDYVRLGLERGNTAL